MKPRIFISAVSSELGTTRQLVANVLTRLGYDPVWQDIFGTEHGDLLQMLREKIDACEGLIHLVGRSYGAEPTQPDTDFGRVSYTQFEFLHARNVGKKTWVVFAEEGCTRDVELDRLDLPRDPTYPHPAVWQSEHRALQDAWRERLKSEGHLRHAATTDTELELKIERLKDEFAELRRAEQVWRRKVAWSLVAISALLLLSVGAGIFIARQQQRAVKLIPEDVAKKTGEQVDQARVKTDQKIESTALETKEGIKGEIRNAVKELTNPIVLAERIRKEIHATAEEKIKSLPDEQGRGRMIVEIEKERDLALGRVDDLIKLIQEGLKEKASPVFQRAAEILQKEGTDEALVYLESRRPSVLETAKRHAEQAKTAQDRANAELELRNKSVRPLILEARLLETKLQWEAAIQIREQISELAPDMFDARAGLGELYRILARFRVAEPHLRVAVKLAATPVEEAISLNNLALLLITTDRSAEAETLLRRALAIDQQYYGPKHHHTALALDNLAHLLQGTNRRSEAESLIRQSLEIREQSLGTEHQDVVFSVNNLAAILQDTNRFELAEPLARRVICIFERVYGEEHPNTATAVGNMAHLLHVTNRLAEAEPLRRRALAIHEQAYGAIHPDVARDLNNLASLLKATNRLGEAESLYRRALAIDEQSYGTAHSAVARDLNNLASLLNTTNRLGAAEPLLRRAVTIDEKCYGAEHPKVADCLNNLAMLLQATNRLAEAESLYRHTLAIDEQSYGAAHPDVARDLNNLASLLKASNRLGEAEQLMRRVWAILHCFQVKTGHEHSISERCSDNYRSLLESLKLGPDEIEQRFKAAEETLEPLKPIVPDIDQLLGPTRSVSDVLAALDRQYKDVQPAIYVLSPDQPMSPYLDELLRSHPDSLSSMGRSAYSNGSHAAAVVIYQELFKVLPDKLVKSQAAFAARLNYAAALRELGAVDQARDELRRLLMSLDEDETTPAFVRGRAHYLLAQCEWRLGDREGATREAEESLKAYKRGATPTPQNIALLLQHTLTASDRPSMKLTAQLLADLRDNKPLPPLAKVDAAAELENARASFRERTQATTALASDFKQSASPLVDKLLGPAKSTDEVFEALDARYREQNKPEIWFLPLNKPIAPHLDELLGPVPHLEKKE